MATGTKLLDWVVWSVALMLALVVTAAGPAIAYAYGQSLEIAGPARPAAAIGLGVTLAALDGFKALLPIVVAEAWRRGQRVLAVSGVVVFLLLVAQSALAAFTNLAAGAPRAAAGATDAGVDLGLITALSVAFAVTHSLTLALVLAARPGAHALPAHVKSGLTRWAERWVSRLSRLFPTGRAHPAPRRSSVAALGRPAAPTLPGAPARATLASSPTPPASLAHTPALPAPRPLAGRRIDVDYGDPDTFLTARTERGSAYSIRAGVLYQAYSRWCIQGGVDPVSLTKFGMRMNELGVSKRGRSRIYYEGLALAA